MVSRKAEAESPTRTSKNLRWRLADLVDMEILVSEDTEDTELRRVEREALQKRDREIFQQIASSSDPKNLHHRSWVFRRWLEKRRLDRFGKGDSPGRGLASFVHWGRGCLSLVAFVLAWLAVRTFLGGGATAAEHPEPANVFWFFVACIFLPCVFTIYGFWVFLGLQVPKLPGTHDVAWGTVFRLLAKGVDKTFNALPKTTPTERLLDSMARVGPIERLIQARRVGLASMLFHVVQSIGLAFVLGVLVACLVDCTVYSRVFGWQTTHWHITAPSVHRFVSWVATPWAWIQGEKVGFPSLEQVEQTRFVRYRNPANFPLEAAAAWSSFLIWGVLVYAFLPRLLLERVSAWRVKALLRNVTFDEPRFDSLWERMSNELVEIQAPEAGQAPGRSTPRSPSSLHLNVGAWNSCFLLVPSDLWASERVAAMKEYVASKKGARSIEAIEFGATVEDRDRLLASLKAKLPAEGEFRILLVQEAFMAPSKEVLNFIRRVQETAGSKSGVLVGLVGKPDPTYLGRPPKRLDFKVWKEGVDNLENPSIDVISFVDPV